VAALFDEGAFFRAVQDSGARALLIGRRALVLLGLPVLTADYDFWIAIDDIALFNDAASKSDLIPTLAADEARRRGRYVLENDEHVDVLVARAVPTIDEEMVAFDDIWSRRERTRVDGADVWLPSIDDLIRTKRIAARPKDLEDIRLLRLLKEQRS
jgi:hypothetical protein